MTATTSVGSSLWLEDVSECVLRRVGSNFALFTEVAEMIELCLVDADGAKTRVRPSEVDGYGWHARVVNTTPRLPVRFRVGPSYSAVERTPPGPDERYLVRRVQPTAPPGGPHNPRIAARAATSMEVATAAGHSGCHSGRRT
jgi:hypothetical protein